MAQSLLVQQLVDVVNDLVLDFGEQVQPREGSLRDLRTGILAVKLAAGESPSGILEIPHYVLALESSGVVRDGGLDGEAAEGTNRERRGGIAGKVLFYLINVGLGVS